MLKLLFFCPCCVCQHGSNTKKDALKLFPQCSNSKTLLKVTVLLFHCPVLEKQQHQLMAYSLLAQSLAVVTTVPLAKVLDVLLLLLVRSASSWSLGFLLRNSRRPSPPENAVFLTYCRRRHHHHRHHRRPRSGLEESV